MPAVWSPLQLQRLTGGQQCVQMGELLYGRSLTTWSGGFLVSRPSLTMRKRIWLCLVLPSSWMARRASGLLAQVRLDSEIDCLPALGGV